MWRIENGSDVRVFEDAWLPSFHNGRTIRCLEGQEDLRVAELMDVNGEWNEDKLKGVLLHVEAEEVMKLHKLSQQSRDVRYWVFDEKGEYSVKSGYLVATSFFDVPLSSSEDENRRWWKYLWSFDLPPHVRVFVWRIFRNIIPTEMNLAKHHILIFGRCERCGRGWGSTEHVLLYCDKIRHFWYSFECWKVLKKWEGCRLWEIGGAMSSSMSREDFQLWLIRMWLMWKALCDKKYKKRSRPWTDLKREGEAYIAAFLAANEHAALAARVLPHEGGVQWRKPKRGRFRLDVDYSADDSSRKGGTSAIVRDSDRGNVFAMAKPIDHALTTLHGELQALVFGIKQCVQLELSPIEAYTDSMLAVIAIAEDKEEESVLYEEFFDFFQMVKNLNVISVNHVGRDANRAAHELARFTRSLDSTVVWYDEWPSWLLEVVADDVR